MARAFRPVLVCGLLLAAASFQTAAETAGRPLPEEGYYVYQPVPDVAVVDSRGESFRLSDRWRERPLVLTMVFASCVRVCPPYIRSLEAAVASAGGAGDEYDVVVLSFDPRDTRETMASLARRHGLDAAPGWTFGVAAAGDIGRLSRAIGFWSDWDERRLQFDHPAMLAGIDDGRVLRILVGAEVSRRRLREVLSELRHDFVPTYPVPSEGTLFRCFDYDPETGGVVLDWGVLLLLTPGLAMFLGPLVIFGRARPRR